MGDNKTYTISDLSVGFSFLSLFFLPSSFLFFLFLSLVCHDLIEQSFFYCGLLATSLSWKGEMVWTITSQNIKKVKVMQ